MEPSQLGEYIAKRRVELGWSQAALARAVNISRPFLTQIENGNRTPSDETLQKLFHALGVGIEQVMRDFLGDKLEPDTFTALAQTARAYDKLSEFLTPDQLQQVSATFGTPDQMEAAMRHMTMGEPMPAGPEGWLELSKEDRRLVQRIVNRLRGQNE